MWDQKDNFSKFINWGSQQGASHMGTWTGCTKRVTKKEEPINLNLAEPSEMKAYAFPVSLC